MGKTASRAFPLPVAFRVKNSGTGASLYQSQEEGNTGSPIYVGMDLITGYFQVEGEWQPSMGSALCLPRLDAMDLENYYLVADVYRLSQTNLENWNGPIGD